MLKLIITDHGDESVGIFTSVYSIDCPFDDADAEDKNYFMEEMLKAYRYFSQGKLTAEYITL